MSGIRIRREIAKGVRREIPKGMRPDFNRARRTNWRRHVSNYIVRAARGSVALSRNAWVTGLITGLVTGIVTGVLVAHGFPV